MINIHPINALQDNYIWFIVHEASKTTIIIDPGEAAPALSYIQQENLTPIAILVTHHHWDHTDGIGSILQQFPIPVYGPAIEQIPYCTDPVEDNDQIAWPKLGIEFNIIAIPGHTRGHIAYYGHNSLFCGDTLFTGGCGRIFEGSAEQLYASLNRIMVLPDSTEIYCGHEYTESNLRFAALVEPENSHLIARIRETTKLRQASLPTVPATLSTEKQTNPFLRCHIPRVQQAVNSHTGQQIHDPVATFAALRQWKNGKF